MSTAVAPALSRFETLTPLAGMPRFPALDGWRGLSILLVLAGHLLPLGPKSLHINAGVAAFGMAIFFTLSGFLIITTLLHRPHAGEFLIRRFCRIAPLAWVYSLIVLACAGARLPVFAAHLLFYGNLPPFWLLAHTAHLWSLCLEVQFYVAVALLCLLFGRRGLWAVPVLCLIVTAHRIETHTLISIVTTVRVDEILAGGTLALVCNTRRLASLRRFLTWLHPLAILPLAIASANDLCGPLDYLRPYLVAGLVGSTLLYRGPTAPALCLKTKWLAYLAAISYALYVLHPMVGWGWFGTGSKILVYEKRMIALVGVFALAHLSTFYFEAFWIRRGKRWSKRLSRRTPLHAN